MSESQAHWEQVYRDKRQDEVSWYRAHLETSLNLIEATGRDTSAAVIDVGGGESTLVDDLLARGYSDVTVLDLAEPALAATRERLGTAAARVQWLCGDVTQMEFAPARYDIWHDRAVFHFLTEPAQRAAYVQRVLHSVRVGGHVIVGTFGPEGPTRCSGLEVARYEPDKLHAEFGSPFVLEKHLVEVHKTPWDSAQQFVWCYCRRA